MNTIQKYLAVPAIAGSLFGIGALGASAHMGGMMGEAVASSGTISAINGNTVTVTIKDATGLKVGDAVNVLDRTAEEANRPVAGKVQSTGSGTFTVQQRDGSSVTVNTSSSTTVKKDGQSGSLSDIVTGAMVAVKGTFDSATKTLAASSVNIFTKGMFRFGFGRHGGPNPSVSPSPASTQ